MQTPQRILALLQYINPVKGMLMLGSLVLSIVLIMLNNSGVVPLALGDFLFFSSVIFLSALYRPGWVFLFFIGLLPFEIINLAPNELGVMLRPYQWVGILTLIAVVVRFFGGRLPFSLPKPHRFDWAVVVFWIGSAITAVMHVDRSLNMKQVIVLGSYIALYALVRVFVRTRTDIANTAYFFMGSAMVVSLYAIWQNIRFAHGLNAFEIMAGRPNSVFAEPDWLGAFLVVVIAALYTLIAFVQFHPLHKQDIMRLLGIRVSFLITVRVVYMSFLYIVLLCVYIALILSVARSAWLGVVIITGVACVLMLWQRSFATIQQWQWQSCFRYAGGIVLTFALSLGVVFIFHLTTFQLFNRVQSTASGLQRITIACEKKEVLPDVIESVDVLAASHCRHITLEEIERVKQQGEIVQEVYRKDPNVSIRQDIYTKTFSLIRNNMVTGVGFGSIPALLGTDERGAGLNASNIFLEVWLGSGLIGIIAFVFVWFSIGIIMGMRLLRKQRKKDDLRNVHLFIFLSWIGLTIFNAFNAGIFLGFFWTWLAVSLYFTHKKY